MHDNRPIGVFDSGIGGLTVVKHLMDILPNENIIYFGDIARLPYGTKSASTITHFTQQTVKFLLSHQVKALVIACNTITSIAKDTVLEMAGTTPVIDVVSSGSGVCTPDMSKRIGVIATSVTIESHSYPNAIKELNPTAQVFSQACPLFVPLIEEGLTKHPAVTLIAREYLEPLIKNQLDTLILGCTHYPLIKDTIVQIVGNKIRIVDPSAIAAHNLKRTITESNKLNALATAPEYEFYVTDIPHRFKQIGEMFLQHKMEKLMQVNIG